MAEGVIAKQVDDIEQRKLLIGAREGIVGDNRQVSLGQHLILFQGEDDMFN